MRYAIGDNVLSPLLQGFVANGLIVTAHERAKDGIGFIECGNGILVDDLKSGHAIECLHMAMIDVGSDISVIDTTEKNAHHGQSQVGIAAVVCELIQAGSIACDRENLIIERCNVTASLVRARLFHLTSRGIDKGHTSFIIVIVRHDILNSRPVVIRLCTTRAVHFHGRLWCSFSTHMVVGFAVAEHVSGMSLPVHLQA